MIKAWRERRRWRRWVAANQDRIGLWQINTPHPPGWQPRTWSSHPLESDLQRRYQAWRRRAGGR